MKMSPNNLAAYYAQISEHELLGRDGEIAIAKQIEEQEVEVWRRLLSFGPALPVVLETLDEKHIDLSRFLPTSSGKVASTAAGAPLGAATGPLARHIREHDRDRILLHEVLNALDSAPRRGRGRAKWREGINTANEAAARTRQRFVNANLRLVLSMGRKFSGYGVPMEDLIQEGNIGLIKGVDRFDHRQGFRFSTYAGWWIRHSMGRAVANVGRTVRVPVHVQDQNQQIRRARREIASKMGREATTEEIAERCNISPDRVVKIRNRARGATVSLDEPMGEDGTTRMDLLVDPANDQRSLLDGLLKKQESASVQSLLDTLTRIQADVLRKRFGLDGYTPMTLRLIGEEYGLSRERIRQIQAAALRSLRNALEAEENSSPRSAVGH